jgi:aldehyde:ferredoxin oxidoreductase
MDSISMSNTIGLAFQLYEMGLITSQDTDGLELVWGNASVVEPLVHRTAHRQGFGDCLADGARMLGKHFGAEDEAVQVSRLEVAYHDRGASRHSSGYTPHRRGACHNQSDYFFVDLGQVEASLGMEFHERHAGVEKAANVAIHQNWRTVFNSLVMCIFSNVSPETVVDLINTACGYHWSVKEMLKAGERGWNLKRVINHRLGLTRANDRLPKPLLEPYGDCLPREACFAPEFEEMLEAYYAARSWDPRRAILPRRSSPNWGWTLRSRISIRNDEIRQCG